MDDLKPTLKRMNERLQSIDLTLAKQEVNLENHMRRTEINEEAIASLRAHMDRLQGGLRLLVHLATGAGLLLTGMQIALQAWSTFTG